MGAVIRSAVRGGVASTAVFSDCGAYRYALTRIWDAAAARVLFVMLNPSTASEERNDPTVARCEARARALGFGGLAVANLFAWRATRPADLRRAAHPIGPGTDRHLLEDAARADLLICAWGNHGALHGRGAEVLRLLVSRGHALHHLGLTRLGQPAHPLYLRACRPVERWDQAAIKEMSDAVSPAPPATRPIA